MDAIPDIGDDVDDSAATPCAVQPEEDSAGIELNALLDRLTSVPIGTDAASAALADRNAAIVDQMFALLLGKVDGPHTAAEFGVLETFGAELAR